MLVLSTFAEVLHQELFAWMPAKNGLQTQLQLLSFSRWKGNAGSKRANCQSFVRELCEVLDLPLLDPSKNENEHNARVFDRFIAPQRSN